MVEKEKLEERLKKIKAERGSYKEFFEQRPPLEKAKRYFRMTMFNQALQYIDEVLKNDPSNKEVLAIKDRCIHNVKLFPHDPFSPENDDELTQLLDKATTLQKKGHYENAIYYYEEYVIAGGNPELADNEIYNCIKKNDSRKFEAEIRAGHILVDPPPGGYPEPSIQYEKISTGTGLIDGFFGGGLDLRRNILVRGPDLSGRRLMIYRFMAKGLKQHLHAFFYLLSSDYREVKQDMRMVLPEFDQFIKEGLVHFVQVSEDQEATREGTDEAVHIVEKEGYMEGIIRAHSDLFKQRMDSTRVRQAFLSVDVLEGYEEISRLFKFMQNFTSRSRRRGAQTMYEIRTELDEEDERIKPTLDALSHLVDHTLTFEIEDNSTFIKVGPKPEKLQGRYRKEFNLGGLALHGLEEEKQEPVELKLIKQDPEPQIIDESARVEVELSNHPETWAFEFREKNRDHHFKGIVKEIDHTDNGDGKERPARLICSNEKYPKYTMEVLCKWPDQFPFPFKIGDTIEYFSKRPGVFECAEYGETEIVTDGSGTTIFVRSPGSRMELIPGWRMRFGKHYGQYDPTSGTKSVEVILRHMDNEISLKDEWGTLDAPDGTWLVFSQVRDVYEPQEGIDWPEGEKRPFGVKGWPYGWSKLELVNLSAHARKRIEP